MEKRWKNNIMDWVASMKIDVDFLQKACYVFLPFVVPFVILYIVNGSEYSLAR